ncbi:hypothetical protein [Azospirillum picis]|uniref:hypothetical protein n=1 Tax=Azospirillum picis TaxID=488438 RepID=UPI001AE93A0F|nr:hypothetical protein [Azospirillum picis]
MTAPRDSYFYKAPTEDRTDGGSVESALFYQSAILSPYLAGVSEEGFVKYIGKVCDNTATEKMPVVMSICEPRSNAYISVQNQFVVAIS